MLLNDLEITELCTTASPMVSPFISHQVTTLPEDVKPSGNMYLTKPAGTKVLSYGLSSAGYDIRIDSKVKVFRKPVDGQDTLVDPKMFQEHLLVYAETWDGSFIIPSGGYALSNSVERFCMPRNVAATCLTKSTYARCGLLVNVTPLEPGWDGWLTLELANLSPQPIKVYLHEGIAQIQFHRISTPRVSYDQRNGKYQNQGNEPVSPRMLG